MRSVLASILTQSVPVYTTVQRKVRVRRRGGGVEAKAAEKKSREEVVADKEVDEE